jgi:hypothetical protein
MNLSWGAGPTEGSAARGSRPGRSPQPPHLAPVPDPLAPNPLARHVGLADQLAPMVDVWERLLTAHQPDRNGRCRTCTQGGTGLPATHWPCALHGLAELARSRHGLAEGA